MSSWDREIKSYLCGRWQSGAPEGRFELVDPSTGEVVATGSTAGLDLSDVLAYARNTGGPALRAMTFGERGEMLARLAGALHEQRERFLDVAAANGGNTRKDAKFDVDGAIGTLQYYAGVGKKLGDRRWLVDGEGIALGRSGRWWGQHIRVPRQGAAIHINAFNFPAWGTFEKAAVAWLAGLPVVTKPAPDTALLTCEMVKVALDAGVLPEGALQLLAGEPGDLLDHVASQDVVAFTGSSRTGGIVRRLERLVEQGVAVNVEADSLNAAVLGADVEEGSETWHLFIGDVVRDMTQKAGQKCTAIRRVLVPRARLEAVEAALVERLSAVRVGDPRRDDVDMGPLTSQRQLQSVLEGLAAYEAAGARRIFGSGAEVERVGLEAGQGYFVSPVLLRADEPLASDLLHEREVFGPVATVMPYDGTADEAIAIVARAGGGLVTSVFSDDEAFVTAVVLGIAPYHGRVYIGDERCASQTLGPGTVLPMMVHGGPGRAGCGEELGAERGLELYLQRVALQGSRRLVERVFGQ